MKTFVFATTIAVVLFIPAYGQEAVGVPSPKPGRIQARRENQQDRIAQGVASGQLTAGETANLENNEAKLNHEVRTDRKANGGRLTTQEKRQVNRQQNRLSRNIDADKHHARTQPK